MPLRDSRSKCEVGPVSTRQAIAPLWAAIAILMAACGAQDAAPAAGIPRWQGLVTQSDKKRLREWRAAWIKGLTKARASHASDVAKEGSLLDPDAALTWQDPPLGRYRCRTIKIGSQSENTYLDFVAYPPFECRLRSENDVLYFAKSGGSQRPIGRILPYGPNRMVFLGTLQLGDETNVMDYGRDDERDMAGILERIGENKWRIALPYPHFESTIDVIELIPDPEKQ